MRYAHLYNHQIPQRSLEHVVPIEALKRWQRERPELFKKRVYNPTDRDTYSIVPRRKAPRQEVFQPEFLEDLSYWVTGTPHNACWNLLK